MIVLLPVIPSNILCFKVFVFFLPGFQSNINADLDVSQQQQSCSDGPATAWLLPSVSSQSFLILGQSPVCDR